MATLLEAPPVTVRLPTLYADLDASLAYAKRDPAAVLQARHVVETALLDGNAYYGINTGFGGLAQQRIAADSLTQLQRNLIVSHAVGVGPLVPKPISRLMLQLKVHALARGFSGVSQATFERLLAFVEHDLIPAVPSRGSLGASGDLAPLSHMALPLIGQGVFWDAEGTTTTPATTILPQHDWEPLALQAKDGLALINGTQLMSAYGAYILEKALHLVQFADIVAAMSLEALQGSIRPFDARIQAIRPHHGQGIVAENIRLLLTDSEILESHRNCGKVQDPYCLRCIPQVHGASRDALTYASGVIETELNAVTDNPLVFQNGDILSGGNFHGQPLALALDFAAMALAELASIAERRIYLLIAGHDGLPRLLMRHTGLNSGFMMPQYTAAALVSENKVLCHPACVDSIPSSLGQEDHVSMGSVSALKLLDVFRNVEQVLAIELLTAAQALDYRSPLLPGRGVATAHALVREHVPHREADASFQEDLQSCVQLAQHTTLQDAIAQAMRPLI